MPGSYDLEHLRRFHKVIFGDVFLWAVDVRTIQIFKETGFCLPQHIESYAAAEFAKLADDTSLRRLALDAGYNLDWTGVEADENIKAAVDAHRGNLGALRQILATVVKPMNIH